MQILAKFDAQDYEGTEEVIERYSIRGILIRDGKFAMQRGKEGEYKIPGGGMEEGETYLETLQREVLEETGLLILPQTAVELGEILEVRRDIFEPRKKYICHSLFYYCKETGCQTKVRLTESEIKKGYHLEWATLKQICDANFKRQMESWIYRDTMFLKMILDGKIEPLREFSLQKDG